MHNYELVIVTDGKATAAKKKTVTESIDKLVKSVKGKVAKMTDLGVKELAYKINKSTTGAYSVLELELEPVGAKDLGGKLRLEPELIRYLLVKKEK